MVNERELVPSQLDRSTLGFRLHKHFPKPVLFSRFRPAPSTLLPLNTLLGCTKRIKEHNAGRETRRYQRPLQGAGSVGYGGKRLLYVTYETPLFTLTRGRAIPFQKCEMAICQGSATPKECISTEPSIALKPLPRPSDVRSPHFLGLVPVFEADVARRISDYLTSFRDDHKSLSRRDLEGTSDMPKHV